MSQAVFCFCFSIMCDEVLGNMPRFLVTDWSPLFAALFSAFIVVVVVSLYGTGQDWSYLLFITYSRYDIIAVVVCCEACCVACDGMIWLMHRCFCGMGRPVTYAAVTQKKYRTDVGRELNKVLLEI